MVDRGASVTPRECSIARTLDIVGEKWSLLAMREVFYGEHRFAGIVRNTGAPRDVLTARLRRLEAEGLLERRRYSERPPRFEYHATAVGRALLPVLQLLNRWGDEHLGEPVPIRFRHDCGAEFVPEVHCAACGRPVTGDDVVPEGLPPEELPAHDGTA